MELQEAAGGPGDDVQQVRHVPCDDVCWSQLLTSPSGKHLSDQPSGGEDWWLVILVILSS